MRLQENLENHLITFVYNRLLLCFLFPQLLDPRLKYRLNLNFDCKLAMEQQVMIRAHQYFVKRHNEFNIFLAAPFGEEDGYDGNEIPTNIQNSDDEQMLSDDERGPHFDSPGSGPHSPAGSPPGSPQSIGNSAPASPLRSPSSSHHSSSKNLKQLEVVLVKSDKND